MNSDEARTIHLLYSTVHQVYKQVPTVWTVQECNRVLTAIMAGKAFSWRVIGITPAALDEFAAAGFYSKWVSPSRPFRDQFPFYVVSDKHYHAATNRRRLVVYFQRHLDFSLNSALNSLYG